MSLSEKDILDMVKKSHEGKLQKLRDRFRIPKEEPEEDKDSEEEDKVVDPEKDDDDDDDDDEPKKPEHLKIDTTMDGLLSRGLRLRHKNSDLEYTVISVSPHDAILLTPEGRPFTVSAEEINKDYELD